MSDNVRTPNINDYFVISKVVRKFPGTISVSVGEQEVNIFDWQKETIDRVKQLETKDDNSDFIQIYEFINNDIKVTLKTEIADIKVRTYYADTFYLEENISGSRNQMLESGLGDIMREVGYTESDLIEDNCVLENGDNFTLENLDNLIYEDGS